MSGFAGIIHMDGAQADPDILERMTRLAERHGGDAYNTWCDSNIGLGHSLLRTTPESANEQQPFSFDKNTWILGDARVDEREPLVAALLKEGRPASLSRPDIELVLHAFCAWGECCIEHFYGDFAFAIWDKEKSSLFCARDSFGVKPFYYAHTGSSFVFSNNLDSIRAYPGTTNELNEAAICDYLAFGYNLDEQATFFRDIARLPPAHTLTCDKANTLKIKKYQRLVCSNRIVYKNPDEYDEHFLELFKLAVNDRLRTDRVGFELSGGLDSTSVAAVTALLGREIPGFFGKGVTTVNSKRKPANQEAWFAAMVAEYYDLEHVTTESETKHDFYAYCSTPQPFPSPFMAASLRYAALIRDHGRVMLSGQGGDPFFHSSGHGLLDEFRESSLVAFAVGIMKSALGRKSLRGLGLRSLWAKDTPRIKLPRIPAWMNSDFLQRAGSIERWKDLYYRPGRYPPGCQAELAWDELHMPFWSHLFEDYYHDLFCGIDCRHPLFDIRLINFLFAIPTSFKNDKNLLRQSMKDLLPEPVRLRPKTGITVDSLQASLAEQTTFSAQSFSLEHQVDWIDRKQYKQALERYAKDGAGDRFTNLNPLNLELWMNNKL